MFGGKPIIGMLGGIGSGKSHVARLFGELGCVVIDSDEQITEAYQRREVKEKLREWWGDQALDEKGNVNRRFIASKVFADAAERRRLEALLHPMVAQMRDGIMAAHANNPGVRAYVWDTPLLAETGLYRQCDALVFVEASPQQRFERVSRSRAWDRAELERREKLQMPLDKKRQLANDVVQNTAGADDEVRSQVREVLSRILAGVGR